jgi:hypothetical protein
LKVAFSSLKTWFASPLSKLSDCLQIGPSFQGNIAQLSPSFADWVGGIGYRSLRPTAG